MGREIVLYIVTRIMKKARFTCDFNILYPKIEEYILKKCFELSINDIKDERLRKNLDDTLVQEAIIELLAREIGKISV